MNRISECRSRIYDHYQSSKACQAHFSEPARRDDYAAYYTAMYLMQDSTEALLAHREKGFGSDSLTAYIELWGIMQAIIIQQDSVKKLYGILTGNDFMPLTGKWKEVRDLRNLCAGYPLDRGEGRRTPTTRTFAGRSFGGYDEVTLESYNAETDETQHRRIELGKLIDAYAEEAAGFLESVEAAMKRRWP